MKRILSVQDFSCIGKCSQSIALPVLSAMGIECVCLPTALLSSHTVFEGFFSRDLTEYFTAIASHWKQMDLRFHMFYSGYLGSVEQVDLVQRLMDDFPPVDGLNFVDPVMADQGALYAGFSPEFPEKMRELCRRADIITPNITEACLLTGLPYRETQDEEYVLALLRELLSLGVKTAILTGIRTDTEHMGVAAMNADGSYSRHFTEYVPSVFHGTGDLFASTCVGALARGCSTSEAIALAADYVATTVKCTANDPDARWYGVSFEKTLPYLMSRLDKLLSKEVSA